MWLPRRPVLTLLAAAMACAVPGGAGHAAAGPPSSAGRGGGPFPGAPPAGGGGRERPTIVLLHGAFTDASIWQDVTAVLQRRGHQVLATTNPLRGLDSDSAYVDSVLDHVAGPAILVAHSYGGAVSTNVTVRPGLRALVYVAASAPAKGELFGVPGAGPGAGAEGDYVRVPYTEPDGSTGTEIYVRREVFADTVTGPDVPAWRSAAMAVSQRPIDSDAVEAESKREAWRSLPSWFLIPGRDRVLSPESQRFMAERAGGVIREVDAAHAVMLTHPRTVADLIEEAALATARAPAEGTVGR
ncbi:alpha/beta fold hydrolase [Streptomyces marincola]|uniref:alpha/beta fold hydrolase n=1 Tax=Streptomyces marincola TaxID=2878388 RepID=UPI001CF5867E|nr:alpha/beta hydrolase [Streptomyces marincola]UCM87748.1 alpha/beta hydrolase [Streptomyces marincola]